MFTQLYNGVLQRGSRGLPSAWRPQPSSERCPPRAEPPVRYLQPRAHEHELLLSPQVLVHGLGEDEPHLALQRGRDKPGET